MGKLTNAGLKGLIEKPGRHSDGDGLFFRTLGRGRAYWVYRYRSDGREREYSIGPYPEVSLIEARSKHAELRKRVVVDKADPLAMKRAEREKVALAKGKPSFGAIADQYVETMGGQWKSAKHRAQWSMTLTKYCAPIRDMAIDEVDTKAVLAVLNAGALWTRAPETASRVRGRIEAVINRARALGLIDENRANPARWKGHLDQLLANPKKGSARRGHHAAMPYSDVPAFMATLADATSTAAKALAFAILTAARSGEVLGATWDEIDLNGSIWTVPASRMKAGKTHRAPLSRPSGRDPQGAIRDARKERARLPGRAASVSPRGDGAQAGHGEVRRGPVHSARLPLGVPRLGGR